MLNDFDSNFIWTLFNTNLSPNSKPNKCDFTNLKAWRPISIGTSENWILEKIFLDKLLPYLSSDDSQFGYKKHHGTFHAIEIVQVSEESDDAHICLLDASSAFDNLIT